MSLPTTNHDPGFRITRASHVVLTVRDLAASRQFYEKVIGLILTAEEGDALYFRGVEEACHHSLVLRKGEGAACARLGLRVFLDGDLDRLKAFFEAQGCRAAWAEVRHQGRTLHATDPAGTPLEFCATMPVEPRMITKFTRHAGGSALRLDHYQVLTPEVRKACEFYTAAGFRLSEYIAPADTFDLRGVFLQRKGNPHDIVFFNGAGPRLHHFAFLAPEVHHLLNACDVAGELGYGAAVERGPGRHGPGHAMYVYMRDPDGHRVELFNTHYQIMDIENAPVGWDPSDHTISFPWGLPARQAWFEEATPFEGVAIREPQVKPKPLTLESYLAK
ncbi:VOC family protein [Bradyrhizobium pachyrhizi]|uniref:VOC family protein n=1 Tax=Bradyrhizobium pachyrhizi TaxID=280333 RepID=UPI0024B1F8D0|nr:VOC family protein [Bradyrhizobium pachyrhizi]WFU57949.1 VOC family protein [Bradyrhizobium pachyrhizi]